MCIPGGFAINPIVLAYPFKPVVPRQVCPPNTFTIKAALHDPAVLPANGYVLMRLHEVKGRTNPFS